MKPAPRPRRPLPGRRGARSGSGRCSCALYPDAGPACGPADLTEVRLSRPGDHPRQHCRHRSGGAAPRPPADGVGDRAGELGGALERRRHRPQRRARPRTGPSEAPGPLRRHLRRAGTAGPAGRATCSRCGCRRSISGCRCAARSMSSRSGPTRRPLCPACRDYLPALLMLGALAAAFVYFAAAALSRPRASAAPRLLAGIAGVGDASARRRGEPGLHRLFLSLASRPGRRRSPCSPAIAAILIAAYAAHRFAPAGAAARRGRDRDRRRWRASSSSPGTTSRRWARSWPAPLALAAAGAIGLRDQPTLRQGSAGCRRPADRRCSVWQRTCLPRPGLLSVARGVARPAGRRAGAAASAAPAPSATRRPGAPRLLPSGWRRPSARASRSSR